LYIENFNSIKPPPLPIIWWIIRKIYRINQGKSKMKCYEHTIIAKQDLQEDQIKSLINKYKDIINMNSGKVLKTEEWGLKNFSHKIKKNKKGFYFHIKFEGTGKTIYELEKAENIDQMLVRYLTVGVKKHDLNNSYFEKKDI
jgi:small subunit ribosomal protein S6